jgi:DNA helicase HerA-like ATPase
VARAFTLGRWVGLAGAGAPAPLHLPPHHLVTHAAVVGMTGSGKTGLVVVLVEEALRSGIPVLAIDLKGDLPNLLLAFPVGAPAPFLPWVDPHAPAHHGQAPEAVAAGLAAERDAGLAKAGLGPAEVEDRKSVV